MAFLNLILLAGAATLVVPWIIHLLNRSRFQTVSWGAMQFLDDVVQVNARRMQWQELLLLLLRCMIPVLLALCLARPVLTAWRSAGAGDQSAIVALVDNSFSMDAPASSTSLDNRSAITPTANNSAFAAALSQADQLVRSTASSTQFAVVTTGGKPLDHTTGTTSDKRKLSSISEKLPRSASSSDMIESLNQALAILEKTSAARRQVLIFSDFQASQWDNVSPQSLAQLRERCQQMKIPPLITFCPISTQPTENISIDELTLSDTIAGLNQPIEVQVAIRNHSDKSTQQTIQLLVDGSAVAERKASLAARSINQVNFSIQLTEKGHHAIEATLGSSDARDDSITTDDRRSAAVEVIEKVPVLVVHERGDENSLSSDIGFLKIAVAPLSFDNQKEADILYAASAPVDRLETSTINNAQIIFLADVSRLSDQQADAIIKSVSSGATLVIASGDRIDTKWYNSKLFTKDSPVLPLAYEEVSTPEKRKSPSESLRKQRFEHPALQIFNDPSNGSFDAAQWMTWHRLKLASKENGQSDPSVTVMAELSNGDPWLVQRNLGKGVVIQCSTSFDDSWTNLPSRPIFVPVVQNLLQYGLFRQLPDRNLIAGSPILWPIIDPVAVATPQAEPAVKSPTEELNYHLITPDQTKHSVPQTDLVKSPTADPKSSPKPRMFRWENTTHPGLYRLNLATSSTNKTEEAPTVGTNEILFAVQSPATESDLRTLTSESIAKIADACGAEVVPSTAEFLKRDQLRETGKEVWKWFLLALVVFLFAEILLQQRVGRVSA